MKTVPAGRFKAKCLAIMDEVEAKREPVLVTKNGKPVVKVVPLELEEDPLAVFRYPGKVKILGDVLSPIHTDEENEDFFEHTVGQVNDRR